MYVYDCVLLDLMILFGNGLEVLEKLKVEKWIDGIIIIFVKGVFDDKIKGLKLGVDDYLVKFFYLLELFVCIYFVIRRK